MKIVIAGAGSVGRSIALELLAHGHDITLIDNMPEKLRIATVADADWVLADACSLMLCVTPAWRRRTSLSQRPATTKRIW